MIVSATCTTSASSMMPLHLHLQDLRNNYWWKPLLDATMPNTNYKSEELTCSPPPDISPMSQQNITSSLLLSWLNYCTRMKVGLQGDWNFKIPNNRADWITANCLLLSTKEKSEKISESKLIFILIHFLLKQLCRQIFQWKMQH